MRIILFSIGNYHVYSHGVFVVLGIIVGGLIFNQLAVKEKLKTSNLLFNLIVSVVVGIVFSRIFYYLFNLNGYRSFYEIFLVWQGGLISFAGFISAGLTFVLLLRSQKESTKRWLELSGIAFPIGLAIGRIGCLLNGEFGVKTKSAWAIYHRMPIPLLESIWCFLIFGFNYWLYKKYDKQLPEYMLIFNFVFLYAFGRFFIDWWRIDINLSIGINGSQLMCFIVMVIAAIIFFAHYLKVKKKNDLR